MKSYVRVIVSVMAAGVITSGCNVSQPSGGVPSVVPQMREQRHDSWMKARTSKTLLYVGDEKANVVYVFDYPSGKLVGTLEGFSKPEGMCVDQKGDIYITNNDYGLMMEYAHGGTKSIKAYQLPADNLIGCSVSATNDVAATTNNGVCIWKGGNGERPTCIANAPNCGGLTFGYDHVGNLIGSSWSDGFTACTIPAGTTTMEQLTMSKIDIPDATGRGTSWDGKYIALGASAGGTVVSQPSKLSGTRLTGVGTYISFDDSCSTSPPDIQTPFFFGTQNVTAASTVRATLVAGADQYCRKSGKQVMDIWAYPKGGSPILRIPAADNVRGNAVSIQE